MVNQELFHHSLKRDKYVNARDGNSHFIDIYCNKCGHHIFLYQKDGKGRLLRMYLDRILDPKELSLLKSKVHEKKDMPALKCSDCNNLIGVPMVYEPERRLAYRLIYGSFMKRGSEGIYPPNKDP